MYLPEGPTPFSSEILRFFGSSTRLSSLNILQPYIVKNLEKIYPKMHRPSYKETSK